MSNFKYAMDLLNNCIETSIEEDMIALTNDSLETVLLSDDNNSVSSQIKNETVNLSDDNNSISSPVKIENPSNNLPTVYKETGVFLPEIGIFLNSFLQHESNSQLDLGISRDILSSILKMSYSSGHQNGYVGDSVVKLFYDFIRPLGVEKSIYFFDIDIMTRMLGKRLNEYAYSKMWRKQKNDILTRNFDHWVIPMERNCHYMTVHIDFTFYDPIITYFDPLFAMDNSIIDILIKFLSDLKHEGLSINPENVKVVEASAPKQKNGIDCGILSLMIAESLLAKEKIVNNFKQSDIDLHRKVLSEFLIYMIGGVKETIQEDRLNVFCRIKRTFGKEVLPKSSEKNRLENEWENDLSLLEKSDEIHESQELEKDLSLLEKSGESYESGESHESPQKRRKMEDLKLDESVNSDDSIMSDKKFTFSNNSMDDSFINDGPSRNKINKRNNRNKVQCSKCGTKGHNRRTCKK